MKLSNKGWGFNEFIVLLGLLFVCLVVVVIFYTKLTKGVVTTGNVKNEFIGESNIKNYIDIEDNITEQAKKYNVIETDDTVIIKFDTSMMITLSNYLVKSIVTVIYLLVVNKMFEVKKVK